MKAGFLNRPVQAYTWNTGQLQCAHLDVTQVDTIWPQLIPLSAGLCFLLLSWDLNLILSFQNLSNFLVFWALVSQHLLFFYFSALLVLSAVALCRPLLRLGAYFSQPSLQRKSPFRAWTQQAVLLFVQMCPDTNISVNYISLNNWTGTTKPLANIVSLSPN